MKAYIAAKFKTAAVIAAFGWAILADYIVTRFTKGGKA